MLLLSLDYVACVLRIGIVDTILLDCALACAVTYILAESLLAVHGDYLVNI